MTDAELCQMVRDAVAKHLGGSAQPPQPSAVRPGGARPAAGVDHPSHDVYLTIVNTTDACVVEPGVTCNHCGYCKSHGH